jgi:hypothetical protein
MYTGIFRALPWNPLLPSVKICASYPRIWNLGSFARMFVARQGPLGSGINLPQSGTFFSSLTYMSI